MCVDEDSLQTTLSRDAEQFNVRTFIRALSAVAIAASVACGGGDSGPGVTNPGGGGGGWRWRRRRRWTCRHERRWHWRRHLHAACHRRSGRDDRHVDVDRRFDAQRDLCRRNGFRESELRRYVLEGVPDRGNLHLPVHDSPRNERDNLGPVADRVGAARPRWIAASGLSRLEGRFIARIRQSRSSSTSRWIGDCPRDCRNSGAAPRARSTCWRRRSRKPATAARRGARDSARVGGLNARRDQLALGPLARD